MSEYTDGLRALADFLDEREDVEEVGYRPPFCLNLFADDADGLLVLARKLGGKWDKTESLAEWFVLRRRFGPHQVDLNVRRDNVCERVQVGTETVQVPDPDAPKVTVERPVYEWKCPDSLGAVAS